MSDKFEVGLSRVWIVMPVLNEAENLRWLLPQLIPDFRVVVVDNGSDDASAAVAKQEGADLVHCMPRGYGRAVQAGFAHIIKANDETDLIVVTMDADGSTHPKDISKLLAPLDLDKDFAIGQRAERMPGAMPQHAFFGNWLQTFLIRVLTSYTYQDMGPMRAMKLLTYQSLEMQDNTWGWNVEMQIKAAMRGISIAEIPLVYYPRRSGKSKISGSLIGSIRAGVKIIVCVFYYWLHELVARSRRKNRIAERG